MMQGKTNACRSSTFELGTTPKKADPCLGIEG